MFYKCSNLVQLPEKFIFNTNNLEEIKGMFYECKSLKKLPSMKDWNISNVKNISFMFFGCENLKEIPEPFSDENKIKNKDISYMTYNCKYLEEKKFFRETKEDKNKIKDEIKEENHEMKSLFKTQEQGGKFHNFSRIIISDDIPKNNEYLIY